jgi:hypothetical protein
MYLLHCRLIGIALLFVFGGLIMGYAPVSAQGNPWEFVGSGINTSTTSIQSSLAIAPDGTPYVAWKANDEFHVHRYNGVIWEEISQTFINGPGDCKRSRTNVDFHIAIGADAIPYLAWQNGQNGTANWDIYACRYNGTNWEQVGTNSATGDGISNNPYTAQFPDIAVDHLNRPYIVWANSGCCGSSLQAGIHVRRFNGTEWEEVGEGSTSTITGGISHRRGTHPQIAIDLNNTPYVAWVCGFDGSGPDQICIRRFNGTEWEEISDGSASWPYGMSHSIRNVDYPSLKIGPGGEPYIAWQDAQSTSNWEIYIRRFNGTEWEEIGEGSASNDGISDTGYSGSTFPELTFTGDGTPYVSWTEDTRGRTPDHTFSLWVRRFNGLYWEETHPGSASYIGDGVDEDVEADNPSGLESDQNGNAYAAYTKNTTAGSEIQVRSLQYSSNTDAPVGNYHRESTVTLTWDTISWSRGYAIEFDDAPDFTTPLLTRYDLASDVMSFLVEDLRNGTYYWRVSARISDTQQGLWSTPRSLIVNLP